jgi:hypothetical protein
MQYRLTSNSATHTEFIAIFLLQNGKAKALQCYMMSMLPILLISSVIVVLPFFPCHLNVPKFVCVNSTNSYFFIFSVTTFNPINNKLYTNKTNEIIFY